MMQREPSERGRQAFDLSRWFLAARQLVSQRADELAYALRYAGASCCDDSQGDVLALYRAVMVHGYKNTIPDTPGLYYFPDLGRVVCREDNPVYPAAHRAPWVRELLDIEMTGRWLDVWVAL